MYKSYRVGVVVPAAGSGVRMGTKEPKQFLTLAGVPIWLRTVGRFESFPEVDAVVVAGPAGRVEGMKQAADRFKKVRAVVAGGDSRQDSVRAALDALQQALPDLILVHDAVRPLVSRRVVCDVLEATVLEGAAVPGVEPKETIKIGDGEDFVRQTPSRNTLVVVQTPQGFRASLLGEGLRRAYAEGFYGTDESSVVERLGVRVKIVKGDYGNIKITTREDVKVAELLLEKGE